MLDYQQNPARQLGGFAVETLAPFDDDQVTQFVEAWYAELAATDRQMVGTAANLQAAIGTRGELRRLAANPLLLTMMAVVHAGRGKLPDARAQLYAECIDLLLLRWRKEPGQPDVLERLKLPQFTASELLALMAELGFKAHEGALRDTANRDEPADLSREQVLQTLERTFARYTVGDPARRAALIDLVLREIAERNGLLLKRSAEQGEVFAFPHRTFQEFLAGYYLKNRPNRLALWLERAPHLHWHEALTLMVGYLAIQDHERESPLAFVAKLLEHSMAERALAGELLHQIGRENAIEYDPTCVLPTGVWGAARKTLLAALSSDAPVAERNRAGLALGLVCYGRLETLDRPGVYVALPDPRLPLSVLGPQAAASPAWHTVMARYWCPIPARPFGFGDDRKDKLSQVTLEEGYQIGPYPITNADYARFVAAGGYDTTQPWWTPNGREYMQREKRRKPDFWTDPALQQPASASSGGELVRGGGLLSLAHPTGARTGLATGRSAYSSTNVIGVGARRARNGQAPLPVGRRRADTRAREL